MKVFAILFLIKSVINLIIKNLSIMAKPIKHTPVVTGKDAVNFFAKMESNKSKTIDRGIVISIREDAQKLKSLLRN